MTATSQIFGSINVQDGGTTSFLKTIHGSRSKIRLLCRLDLKQNETTAPFSSRYNKRQNFRTWGARKTAGVARAQTLDCQVLGLTTGTILQDCTRPFVAHKKLENVSEENQNKLIHCPRKSLIFQDFQGPTHIFQVFQNPYEPCTKSLVTFAMQSNLVQL